MTTFAISVIGVALLAAFRLVILPSGGIPVVESAGVDNNPAGGQCDDSRFTDWLDD